MPELPAHILDAFVRAELLRSFGIEIGGGLGELLGQVWRIGVMGESSTQANVMTLLSALETIFLRQKWIPQPGIALKAASGVYASQEWEANA